MNDENQILRPHKRYDETFKRSAVEMGDTLATTPPLAALDMAFTRRKPPRVLVHHSDRGVQYASAAYRQPKDGLYSTFSLSATS